MLLVILLFGNFEKFPLTVSFMYYFNPDNCCVRLIPSNVIENWIRELSSSDPKLEVLHLRINEMFVISFDFYY